MQYIKKGTCSCNYLNSLRLYKNDAKRAAKELRYGDDVVNQIENAKSDMEITRILATARNGGNI